MRTEYLVVLIICTSCICACAGDSYSGDIQSSNSLDFGNDSGGYSYSSPPSNSYLPPATPAPEYLPPPNNGYQYNPPPNNNYLPPPNNNYLPPPPEYGPPAGYPSYGPPPPPFYKPAPFIPYHSHDSILEKLKSKINLYTLGKILLKLLIFKKIVKFIGLIFLLLVLPKLKNIFKDDMMSGSGESDGMESKLVETDKDKLAQQIENLYDFVINSIENFEGRSS
ncbi:uncharacterized protein LOC6619636 [Drosophila sechellia]|uniref:Uncharacterized protein LOC117143204 n=1 Tax=Drosophila mauritiana TaxID=7226 RepID=A0A6P8K418_DROMA|nr:uncharacterized protein LOC6619636 [Drosophila sechellia]XP_033163640.1 uncharacterized protein LOC117143204 [Drosophila mauritiana]